MRYTGQETQTVRACRETKVGIRLPIGRRKSRIARRFRPVRNCAKVEVATPSSLFSGKAPAKLQECLRRTEALCRQKFILKMLTVSHFMLIQRILTVINTEKSLLMFLCHHSSVNINSLIIRDVHRSILHHDVSQTVSEASLAFPSKSLSYSARHRCKS